MGLTTGAQRDALLEVARLATKQTSFARQLAQQSTIYDHQRSQARLIDDLAGAVAPPPGSPAAAKKKLADVKIISTIPPGKGFNPAGYYHDIKIDFALGPQSGNSPNPPFTTDDEKAERDAWGTVWEKDLTNPRRSCVYMVRATLSQLRVEPLLGGFYLRWVKPAGWVWVDGQPLNTPVQVVSNPLVVIRLVQSPAARAVNNTGFSCNAFRQYP